VSEVKLNENGNLVLNKRVKALLILIFSTNQKKKTLKEWPSDPLVIKNLKLEVSEKLPQG